MFKRERVMKKSEETKQNIIECTIELIKEMDGDLQKVTMRRIAGKAGIGVGLINHYFQSKEKLVEICVQQIITGTVTTFQPKGGEGLSPIEKTKHVVKQVMDYLMENPQISRISILGDLAAPNEQDNSSRTAYGFAYFLSDGNVTESTLSKAKIIVAIIQSAFLRKDTDISETMNFNCKEKRDQFIDDVVDMIGGKDEVLNH
jgi:AcrR family transcriptional regulator